MEKKLQQINEGKTKKGGRKERLGKTKKGGRVKKKGKQLKTPHNN